MSLMPQDFQTAAQRIGCDEAAIRAIAHVESRGTGFNPDGSLVILFEGHVFSRLTDGKYDHITPDISYPTWDRSHYGKNYREEQARLLRAMTLDPELALRSTSMGRFQIMGFNHRRCGFSDARSMYETMRRSEGSQLQAFVGFILGDAALTRALQIKDWALLARLYNGPRYAENKYDVKLANAYQAFAGSNA
jgi:hypothetical protein